MNWVRRVAEDGRCAEYDSLGAWEAEAGAAADSLVIETPLPHSLSLPESFWKRAAARLVPGGLLRVQAALPADLPPPAPGAAPSGFLQAFVRTLETFGLAFVSSQPEHLQEYEFLDRHLGQAAAWLGCERTEACRFVRLTFCKPAPPAAPRLKLGLITQDLYYSFVYESPALAALFEIRKMEYRPFCEPEYYQPLYDFQPDVLLVFRPDYLLPKTLARFRCPTIGYASEPLPRLRGGEVLASDYNRQSYELLKKVRGCCGPTLSRSAAGTPSSWPRAHPTASATSRACTWSATSSTARTAWRARAKCCPSSTARTSA